MGVFTHEEIMNGLANAMSKWKRLTQGRLSKQNKRQKLKKRANTVPISPNLATKKRLGKTKREVDGEKLRKERFKQNMMETVTKPRYNLY